MTKIKGYFLYFPVILCFLALFVKPYYGIAQSKPLFGLQVKPIIPSKLFSTTADRVVDSGVTFEAIPKVGYTFGGVVRHRIYRGISIETGLSYVNRSYTISLQDSANSTSTSFRFINYEIPVLALIYIQLSERAFINNAFGFSLDFFPSDIYTEGSRIRHFAYRKQWVLPALTANIGFEYRTRESGFFYLGGSYHRMLYNIAQSRIQYERTFDHLTVTPVELSGHYFSVDFKYFFPLRTKDPEPMLY